MLTIAARGCSFPEGWGLLSFFSESCADMSARVTGHYSHYSLCTQHMPVQRE